jgi:hypothetical protein
MWCVILVRKNILNAAAIRIISGLMEKYENVKSYCLNLNSTIVDNTSLNVQDHQNVLWTKES